MKRVGTDLGPVVGAGHISRRRFLSGAGMTATGLVLAGGMGGLLSACGGSAGPESGGGPAGQASGRSSATPRRGGTLKVGLQSDFNSFSPPSGQFDAAGLVYASTVFDPLMAIDAQGRPQPYLAKGMTPNADHTVWTMTLRPGVVFHDGSPCTSAEVVNAMQAVQQAALTGAALRNLDTVRAADPMTVIFTCKTPWPAFPAYLTGQLGYVPSPKTLSDKDGGLHPVGTGPFVFAEWVPGSHFYANANPHYWQHGLPYVDRVEYSTIPDSTTRENSLLAGTIDLMHSPDALNLRDLSGKSSVQYLTDAHNIVGEPSMDMTMINCADPVTGDVRVRQALAHAFDNDLFQRVHNFALYEPKVGLFPDNPAYAKTNAAYPTFDLAKAKSLVQAYEADKGKLTVEYATTSDQRSGETAQFLQQQWSAAGINVKISQIEQVRLITNALRGQYQLCSWRRFGVADPDQNYIWWSIPNSASVGQLALNFARYDDPQVQAALDAGRTSLDDVARTAAYNEINARFAAGLPYLFTNKTVWACYANRRVQNFNGHNLPDGQPAVSFTGGQLYPVSTWLSA